MNILITSASRKISLVRAFQQALAAQQERGKVIALDITPYAPALYFADEHYLVPPSDDSSFIQTVLDLCRRFKVRLLVPTRDEELPIFAEQREKFAALGSLVMVSAPSTLRICQDKKLFLDFCRQHGFATPAVYHHQEGNLTFPLFAKPRFGKGGRKTLRVDSQEELDLLLQQRSEMILQEYVQAPEYTIDVFADFEGKVISAVPRERLRVFGGESFVSKTSKNPLLVDEAVRLTGSLGLIGHITIQCFLDDGQAKFIEVNPRFGGAANLGIEAGCASPLFLIKLLKGEELRPQLGVFKEGLVMLRYTQDLFLDADKMIVERIP